MSPIKSSIPCRRIEQILVIDEPLVSDRQNGKKQKQKTKSILSLLVTAKIIIVFLGNDDEDGNENVAKK